MLFRKYSFNFLYKKNLACIGHACISVNSLLHYYWYNSGQHFIKFTGVILIFLLNTVLTVAEIRIGAIHFNDSV